MGWLPIIRFTLIFVLLFFAVPGAIRGRAGRENWSAATVETFGWTAAILHAGLAGLGVIRLALPGATMASYVLWICALCWVRMRKSAAVELLERVSSVRMRFRLTNMSSGIPWFVVAASLLAGAASYPARHVQLSDQESYTRALTLAQMANGEKVKLDLSTPLLLPLMYASAVSPAETVAVSGPLFLTLFAAAAGFVARRLTGSRIVSLMAMGVAAVATAAAGVESGPANLAAAMLLFAFGLWPERKGSAGVLALTAVTVATGTDMWRQAAIGLSAAAIAAAARPALRLLGSPALAGIIVAALWLCPQRTASGGSYQYEAAARACQRIAAAYPRNSWLVVSSAQELAFTYGKGWHLNSQQFISEFSVDRVSDPSFRFPYPVAQIFFFVERGPLPGGRHAGIQFEAADLLAAYAGSHSDVEVVYADERLSVYRTPGTPGR